MSTQNKARHALYKLLRQPSSYGSVLLLGLCDLWGVDWLQFEPQTIQLEIKDEFNLRLEPDLFDKLMAAVSIVTTDQVFNNLPAFITTCNALSGDGVDTPVSAPMEIGDLAWVVCEIILLWPEGQFNEEITGYMEQLLKWQGVNAVPNSLINILSDATFDEVQSDDPEVMQNIFDKIVEVNDEVISNLEAWKYQISQLKLINGSTEQLLSRFKEVK